MFITLIAKNEHIDEERCSNINAIESIEKRPDGFTAIRFISGDYFYTTMNYDQLVATIRTKTEIKP